MASLLLFARSSPLPRLFVFLLLLLPFSESVHHGPASSLHLTAPRPWRELQKANLPLQRLRGGSSLNPNFEEVGAAFVLHYYKMFDTNRAAIRNLYQDNSMLTFEGEKFQGVEAISQKLNGLQFQTVEHEIVTSDYQPTNGGGILVFVCGHLKVDGSEHPMKFSQVFSLMPLPGGQGYYCFNDVFRLIYG